MADKVLVFRVYLREGTGQGKKKAPPGAYPMGTPNSATIKGTRTTHIREKSL